MIIKEFSVEYGHTHTHKTYLISCYHPTTYCLKSANVCTSFETIYYLVLRITDYYTETSIKLIIFGEL